MFGSSLRSQQRFLVRFQSTATETVNPKLATIFPKLSEISASDLNTNTVVDVYHIPRTSKGNLPVYKTIRSQAVYTDIKRVQGDLTKLRNDLQELLPEVKKSDFTCVLQSGSLRIKGDHGKVLREILSEKF
ncbi:hypothetical protein CANARDRAFT_29947 [[Candida] arabinofermentans NRRL YB-2248]|uniref:Large ribosomal subunit protein mL49 n=1 Tax=[Candida] arabinofermentans NRRL YB-2248 TaxID=983967 RepID=A0A1E4SVP8_9ASCO|nr:hypothetical protein CANARDRAFT_29947 [[Candida] arabinofermentans NRRL YB-2248]